jgi:hypothetical protein
VTAAIGSVYRRTDGGTATTLYVKESGAGNTGWVAVGAGGGGSGTINSGVTNIIPKYTASTTIDDSLLSDDGTTLTYTGTGGLSLSTTGAGYVQFTEGTAPALVANTFQLTAPADVASGGLSFILPAAGATGFLKTTNSSGTMTLSVDTSTYITASSTDTLTNKTYDTTGTGNVFTSTHFVPLAAAGCQGTTAASFWDLPATTPAVPACVTGTNVTKGVLDFADTTGGFSAQYTFALPTDLSGTLDARILWTTTATSGNVEWSLSVSCSAVDATETDDTAFTTPNAVVTAAPGVANRVQTSSITSVTITPCAAGELFHVKVFRDGNDAQDTLSATARLVSVDLILRRAQ